MLARVSNHHISIAMPTVPPITQSISFITLPVRTATPVCNPGAAVPVPVPVPCITPASPVGVGLSSPGFGTMVIAVTVDWLPSGRVVVRKITLDLELCLRVDKPTKELGSVVNVGTYDVIEPMVLASPPTVVTMMTPNELVIVKTEPTELDSESSSVGVGDGDERVSEAPADGVGSVSVKISVVEGSIDTAPDGDVDSESLNGLAVSMV